MLVYPWFFQDHCILTFTSLEKQGRPGNVRGYLRVLRFNQDPSLCPVAALVTYHNQVCLLCNHLKCVFLYVSCSGVYTQP